MIGKFKDWFKDESVNNIETLEERVEALEDRVSGLREEDATLYEKLVVLRNEIARVETKNDILVFICVATSIAAIAVAFLK